MTMEATSKKAANAVLRVFVAIGLLTGLIVVPIATASATGPNNAVPVDNLPGKPAQALTDDTSCDSLQASDFPTSTDLYHFVVARSSDDGSYELKDNGSTERTTTTYVWKRQADFADGTASVRYVGDSSFVTLPRDSFNGKFDDFQDGHLYVAVPTGKTLAEAKLNYDIPVTGTKTVKVEKKQTGRGNNWDTTSNSTTQLSTTDIAYLKDNSSATKYPTVDYIVKSDGSKSSHILSHTCAYPLSPPTITIDNAVGEYEETYTKSYSWTLDKGFLGTQVDNPDTEEDESISADDLYFSQGEAPQFEIKVGRSGPEIDSGSYLLASATVTGKVRLEFAAKADASLSLELSNASGALPALSSSCTIDDETATAGTYDYTCTLSGTAPSTSKSVLEGVGFTVSGTVNTDAGEDDNSKGGSFTTAKKSEQRGATAKETADLTDDLAELGAIMTETKELVEGGDTETKDDDVYEIETTWSLDDLNCGGVDCEIDEGEPNDPTDDKLVVSSIDRSATITYASVWDWEKYRDNLETGACSVSYTNTANLNTLESPAVWEWSTSCPPPTVVLGADVTSSYSVTYDDVYSWSVMKTFNGQDKETLNALYEVVATRSGPEVKNIQGSNVTISGTYKATFAAWSNVKVSVAVNGETVDCDESEDGPLDDGSGEFECTIDDDELAVITDEDDGWEGLVYEVTAVVETAGGDDTATTTGLELATPESSTPTLKNERANITDNLGATVLDDDSTMINENNGYMALNIVCETETGLVDDEETEDVDESTSCGDWGSDGVPAGTLLQTDTSANTITLTYELDFLNSLDKESACPEITNMASVLDGESKVSASQENQMKCPVLTITVTHDPGYEMKWDTVFTWKLAKTWLGQDAVTWQPQYKVEATRTAGTPGNFAILDGSQMVSGSIELTVEPDGIFTPTKVMVAGLGLTLDTDTTECAFDETEIGNGPTSTVDTDGYFDFDCTVATESTTNSAGGEIASTSGISGTPYVLNSTGSLYKVAAMPVYTPLPLTDAPNNGKSGLWGVPDNGTLTSAEGSVDIDAEAKIVDDTASLGALTIIGGQLTGTTLSTPMESGTLDTNTGVSKITLTYTVNWLFDGGKGCNQTIVNTATLYRSTTTEPSADLVQQVTKSVTCEKAEPGLTIGFYGNKQGGTQVVDYQGATPTRANPVINGSWRDSTKLPNGAPDWTVTLKKINASSPWTSDSQVRRYMTDANCNSGGANSGGKTCQTMFRAQALASVMNAIKNPKFGEQAVMFQGSCTKVSKLFTDALASTVIDAGTTPALIASRIAYKSIFDDLNNTRATRCPVGNQ